MTKQEIETKLNSLWQEIFVLQQEACKGKLCTADMLKFNDLDNQIEELCKLLKT